VQIACHNRWCARLRQSLPDCDERASRGDR